MGEFLITYTFVPDGREPRSFDLSLDSEHFELAGPARQDPPEWTRLEYHQCSNCPLTAKDCSHCPAAVDLCDVISDFQRKTADCNEGFPVFIV